LVPVPAMRLAYRYSRSNWGDQPRGCPV